MAETPIESRLMQPKESPEAFYRRITQRPDIPSAGALGGNPLFDLLATLPVTIEESIDLAVDLCPRVSAGQLRDTEVIAAELARLWIG